MSWYSEGHEAAEAMRQQYAQQRKQNFVDRFYIKSGGQKNLVFIDDHGFNIREHSVKVNGDWRKFTCAGKGCLFCERLPKNPGSPVSCFTVIDLDGYVDRQGVVQKKNATMVLVAGTEVSTIIHNLKISRPEKSIVGVQYLVKRKPSVMKNNRKQQDYSTGSEFNFVKDWTAQRVLSKHQALNYMTAMAPLPPQDMQAVIDQILAERGSPHTEAQGAFYNQPPQGYPQGQGYNPQAPAQSYQPQSGEEFYQGHSSNMDVNEIPF